MWTLPHPWLVSEASLKPRDISQWESRILAADQWGSSSQSVMCPVEKLICVTPRRLRFADWIIQTHRVNKREQMSTVSWEGCWDWWQQNCQLLSTSEPSINLYLCIVHHQTIILSFEACLQLDSDQRFLYIDSMRLCLGFLLIITPVIYLKTNHCAKWERLVNIVWPQRGLR